MGNFGFPRRVFTGRILVEVTNNNYIKSTYHPPTCSSYTYTGPTTAYPCGKCYTGVSSKAHQGYYTEKVIYRDPTTRDYYETQLTFISSVKWEDSLPWLFHTLYVGDEEADAKFQEWSKWHNEGRPAEKVWGESGLVVCNY